MRPVRPEGQRGRGDGRIRQGHENRRAEQRRGTRAGERHRAAGRPGLAQAGRGPALRRPVRPGTAPVPFEQDGRGSAGKRHQGLGRDQGVDGGPRAADGASSVGMRGHSRAHRARPVLSEAAPAGASTEWFKGDRWNSRDLWEAATGSCCSRCRSWLRGGGQTSWLRRCSTGRSVQCASGRLHPGACPRGRAVAVVGLALYVGSRLVAPGEEHELAQTFGEAWSRYADAVKLPWL